MIWTTRTRDGDFTAQRAADTPTGRSRREGTGSPRNAPSPHAHGARRRWRLTMGKKTKIDWCDATWNPVTGCLHGCEYCYARRIAERFGKHLMPIFTHYSVLNEPVREVRGICAGKVLPYPFDFTPTYHRYKLGEPSRWTKPRTIFVCSMADLFGDWVPDEWIEEVFQACKAAPQHRYLFLTKNPDRYFSLHSNGELPNEKNFFYYTADAWCRGCDDHAQNPHGTDQISKAVGRRSAEQSGSDISGHPI